MNKTCKLFQGVPVASWRTHLPAGGRSSSAERFTNRWEFAPASLQLADDVVISMIRNDRGAILPEHGISVALNSDTTAGTQ
jgi:hypothetical protein